MEIAKLKQLLRGITAWVVLSQLLLGQLMAASADLHHHCHDHSHDPAHECVVSLMLQGGYGEVLPDILPVNFKPEPPETTELSPKPSDSPAFHLLGGVLAHAPPRGP